MSADERRFFEENDFPIYVVPDRISFISNIEDARFDIHEAIEIKVFYEGVSTLIIGNDTVIAKAGDVVIINPYEFHAMVSCNEEKGKYHLIMVGIDFFSSLCDIGIDLRHLFFTEKKALVTHISNSKELIAILNSLVEEWVEKREFYKLKLKALMFEAMALIMRHGLKDTSGGVSDRRIRSHATIEPALQKIRQCYRDQLTLDELADVCCVNKYHFCRIFKEIMGTSPMQYLCDYRLNHADIIIRNTNMSISDVIFDCGFNDKSYFYKCYKSRFGSTPSTRKNSNK